jgi:hypothetical protein
MNGPAQVGTVLGAAFGFLVGRRCSMTCWSMTGTAGGLVIVARKAGLLGQSSLSGPPMSRLEVV